MPEAKRPNPNPSEGGFDRGFEGHRERQAALGLDLTPAERLRWLEEAMEELRRVVGRAHPGTPMTGEPPAR